ncbi:MAG: Coenzyme F420 hydrogenase/dehydrogenase, beta subunit C-terminal domain [Actinomycetota bacterium]
MTPSNLLPVIDSGMCIGCGACVAADPSLRLEFDERNQMWQPNGPGNAEAVGVCPAVQVDFEHLHEKLFPGQEVTPHGVVEQVLLAQSTNRARNLAASSGGLIKELMLELLRSGQVDGVIALTEIQGLHYEPRLITELDEIDSLPGSIYHHVPFDNALRILREKPGRYALVAIPCQLEGIFTYIFKHEPELADRIAITIGLLCGWLYSHHALRALAQFKGIAYEQVQGISYRGEGPVGKLTIQTDRGPRLVSRRIDFDYQVAFDRSFNTPRCHVCINHSNFLADIVVGDAWLPSTLMTRSGISLVVCRKPQTLQLVQELIDGGQIVATEVSVDEITESQTRKVVFGDFAYAYADYLKEIGRHVPQMAGPNRTEAQLADRDAVRRFDNRLLAKLALQRAAKYRQLWWRKASVEAWPLAKRYLTWFFVRVLKIKSLTGKRKEVGREKTSIFR